MSQFIESIRIHNGVTENLTLHQKRVNKTLRQKAGEGLNLNKLLQELQIPKNGLFKWRLEYTKDKIKQNQLIPYTSKTVKRIKLVEAPDLKYALKYSDRNSFEKLLTQSNADDIIITQKGLHHRRELFKSIFLGWTTVGNTFNTPTIRNTKGNNTQKKFSH